VTTGQENVAIRVSGAFETEADLLEVSLVVNGRMLRLGDIATIRRTFVDPPQPLLRINGERGIALAISMAEGGDILELGAAVDAAMQGIVADLPLGIEPILVSNQPQVVDQAIGEFTESLWQAVAIILVVSFLSLGVRPGTVVAIAIPLTLAIVFTVMQAFSIDLHRISLGALIIALGLLVDDAMTTIDAMLRRLAAGDTIEKAASFAYGTLAAPMLIGTLITIAGFVPVGFAQSSAGEYTISLFYVVGIALIASWFVAVIFAPLIGAVLLKPPAATEEVAKPGAIMRSYLSVVGIAIRARWVTLAITVALLATAFVGLGRVDRQFFPASDRGELIVDFQLPRSSSIFASEDAVERIETFIAESGDAESITSYVGRNVIRFYLPLDIQPPSDHQAQIVVMSKDLEARDRLEVSLKSWLNETFPEAISRISPLELGPPVGWPIQYRMSGPDLEIVRARALDLAGIIAANPNTRDVHFDWIEPARQIRIEIDQDRARRLGLTSAQVASILNTAISGTTVSRLRDDSYDQEQPLLWRRDRVPTLTVLADTAPGISPEAVVEQLTDGISTLVAELGPGYEVLAAGTVAESAESQASVFAVLPVMLFLMVTLLMIQLRDFRNMTLVLVLLPLGLIGVVSALLLFGRPLGFVAILGILALNGMIAKNAVILITQISEERAAGMKVREAVVKAASSRFRPLLLTALSTVLGLMPIAPTLFWGPMAFATMGGLLVATVLTLVFLPTVYTMLHRDPVAAPASDDV
jgi:multidrug efflux pump subunit AcrB